MIQNGRGVTVKRQQRFGAAAGWLSGNGGRGLLRCCGLLPGAAANPPPHDSQLPTLYYIEASQTRNEGRNHTDALRRLRRTDT
jgi:hypothetical protein